MQYLCFSLYILTYLCCDYYFSHAVIEITNSKAQAAKSLIITCFNNLLIYYKELHEYDIQIKNMHMQKFKPSSSHHLHFRRQHYCWDSAHCCPDRASYLSVFAPDSRFEGEETLWFAYFESWREDRLVCAFQPYFLRRQQISLTVYDLQEIINTEVSCF